MNILILSCGTRVKLVEYFVENFKKHNREVYTADCSEFAPALYFTDKHFILPKIDDNSYVDEVIKICKENKIKSIISVIDPELSLLSKNIKKFHSENILPIISNEETVKLCFNKFLMHNFLVENGIDTPKSYINIDKIWNAIDLGEIEFPLFAKPVCGSASLNMMTINNKNELKDFERENKQGYIVQEFIEGKEYGADVYIDMISDETVDIFIKEKIKMRAGETDKSVSVRSKKIEKLVSKVVDLLDLKGPIDIDIFEKNGKYLISEINPRFGGGYPHAYESGHNFIDYILKNLENNVNKVSSHTTKSTTMLKYSEVLILEEGELD